MTRTMTRKGQRGAVTLIIALLILVALAIVGIAGTRLVLTQHRISGNSARADAAFAAAEAGVQNAIAYLNANRSVVASAAASGWMNAASIPKWTPCANGATALPCGNGTSSLYPTTWLSYGQLTNQQSLGSGNYSVSTWLLSNTVNATPQNIPSLPCTSLNLTSVLAPVTVPTLNLVNGILNSLFSLLLGPNTGIPSQLCLPINFSTMPPAPWASSINPSITVVASASDPADTTASGIATVQQVLAATNLFAGVPVAALMVNGTVNLTGDLRIWGNMRPPTQAPVDFSLLKLNDIAGLPVGSTLNALLGSSGTAIANSLNLSFAPVLTGVTPASLLLFDWDVTFPLSIWSSNTTSFGSTTFQQGLLGLGASVLSSARTCLPQFGGAANSPCTPLSEAVLTLSALGVPLAPLLQLHLPDVQDPTNLLSTATGLLSSTPAPTFPADLFNYTYGYPSAQSATIQNLAAQPSDCSAVGSGALYWVSGNCSLSGTVGSATAPVTIITTGNVTLAAGTDFYGVIYQRGNSAKTFTGPASGTRAMVHGAVVSEGNFTGTGNFNIVYDINAIRAAGFRAGGFAPIPGGWNDALTGP